jgi:L,D-peptidoglycan transpeptidase YkuD (ErfK/YbiS/YcfS/YnhG family)
VTRADRYGRLIAAIACSGALVACSGGRPATTPGAAVSADPGPTVAAAAGSAGAAPASALLPAVESATDAGTPSEPASPSAAPSTSAERSPSPSAKPSTAPAPPLLVEQLASVGKAQQVVIVTSASWSTSSATLQTFEKDTSGWHAVFPAMPAHIGRNGFSADKHEGDLKTPVGQYGFGTMFGQHASPGVKFPYRMADAQSVWVDQSSSPFYNTWQENAALGGEHLASAAFATSYAYAVDIAYNTQPIVPGKGSAIFLHVSTGGGTAGCVSIADPDLLRVLRWLDPARAPVIVMGPTSVIRQY